MFLKEQFSHLAMFKSLQLKCSNLKIPVIGNISLLNGVGVFKATVWFGIMRQ